MRSRSPLHAKMTSLLVRRSRARAPRARSSVEHLVVAVGCRSSSSCSPLPDHEAVDAVVVALLHELVARRRRTTPRSRGRTRVGREGLDHGRPARNVRSPARSSRSAAGRTGPSGPACGHGLAHRATSFGIVPGARSGSRPCGTVSQYSRLNIHFAMCQHAVGRRRHRRVLVVEAQRRRLAVARLEEAHDPAAVVRPSARCRGPARRCGWRRPGPRSARSSRTSRSVGWWRRRSRRSVRVRRPAACAGRRAASRLRRPDRSRSRPARHGAAGPAPAGRIRASRPPATGPCGATGRPTPR